jgi:hypothetical protein
MYVIEGENEKGELGVNGFGHVLMHLSCDCCDFGVDEVVLDS